MLGTADSLGLNCAAEASSPLGETGAEIAAECCRRPELSGRVCNGTRVVRCSANARPRRLFPQLLMTRTEGMFLILLYVLYRLLTMTAEARLSA